MGRMMARVRGKWGNFFYNRLGPLLITTAKLVDPAKACRHRKKTDLEGNITGCHQLFAGSYISRVFT